MNWTRGIFFSPYPNRTEEQHNNNNNNNINKYKKWS